MNMSTNETTPLNEYSIAHSIKFAVLLALEIPSVLISIFIFAYFIFYRRTRINEYNYSIFVLLAINFLQVITDLPMPIDFFRFNDVVRPASSAYCTWWVWYEFSLNTVNGFLMAWISTERHLLIFHRNWLRTPIPWKRNLIRHGPLLICSLWGPLFYLVTVVIEPMCQNQWYFDSLLCGTPCYLLTNWGTFDLFFDVITPTCLIFLMNFALFIRVIYQQTMTVGRRQNHWRRSKKMAFQLGLISFVYLAVWIPLSIAELGQIYIDPTFLLPQLEIFDFLVYIVPLILPMLCLMSMPELVKTFKKFLSRLKDQKIRPADNTATRGTVSHHPASIALADQRH